LLRAISPNFVLNPMSEAIISVENVGKKYRIRHLAQHQRYTALRDVITDRVKGLFLRSKNSDFRPPNSEDFWALRNVSFEVKQGEVVGIIGRNGAGKSTLLKILSRITEPTEGRVRLRGRVASLLEVGTGFHPELTGRENIFLNGAILGMHRAEIKQKFDEIVAFSEVERFLDTPVKRYSSGMYVRLAFAVAAHLEPEILVVDEVLAVGDAEFQKKCLGKMSEIAHGGRTVLFVSHNLGSVRALCESCVLLNQGQMVMKRDVNSVLASYSGSIASNNHRSSFEPDPTRPSITSVTLVEHELLEGNLVVDIGFESPFAFSPIPGIVLTSHMGVAIYGSNARLHRPEPPLTSLKGGLVRVRVDKLPIHSGLYSLSVWLGDWHGDYDRRRDAISFEFRPDSQIPNYLGSFGYVNWPASWTSTTDIPQAGQASLHGQDRKKKAVPNG
jgi:lipopolysaccharide transport system ATP-binding protein